MAASEGRKTASKKRAAKRKTAARRRAGAKKATAKAKTKADCTPAKGEQPASAKPDKGRKTKGGKAKSAKPAKGGKAKSAKPAKGGKGDKGGKGGKGDHRGKAARAPHRNKKGKLKTAHYEAELARLQEELVKLQYWVKEQGLRIVALFEGRDAAGKGGVIKRITECLNPRGCRVVALGTPTERERTQWYFQRYVPHLPAAGEIVLFDRSWYNRAGVERVMGFCSHDEYREFLFSCPMFERMLVRSGIILVKYWFSVSDEEQERRFRSRARTPTKRWKLSPMDLQSRSRWVEYSKAKDVMFDYTDIKDARWNVVNSDDKKRARLNCIAHLLSVVPYEDVLPKDKVVFPTRQQNVDYVRPPLKDQSFVAERY